RRDLLVAYVLRLVARQRIREAPHLGDVDRIGGGRRAVLDEEPVIGAAAECGQHDERDQDSPCPGIHGSSLTVLKGSVRRTAGSAIPAPIVRFRRRQLRTSGSFPGRTDRSSG